MEEVVLLADDWKGVGEKDKAVGATARVAASVAMEEIFMVSLQREERWELWLWLPKLQQASTEFHRKLKWRQKILFSTWQKMRKICTGKLLT